ncbi:MAG: hypothetical protein J6386_00880 [Candidatus Synoicihabitans palmerolidicus]|nr:hypothetical protein [Candidatus Synoicihabitans palmerolidicus]
MKSPPRRKKEEVLQRFDTNNDGKLDKTERQAMRASMDEGRAGKPGRGGEMRGRMGERFDADGDGKLSETERAAAETTMRAEIAQRPRAMERVDTDKDGQISNAEWAVAREQMNRGRGPGGPGGGKRPRDDNR